MLHRDLQHRRDDYHNCCYVIIMIALTTFINHTRIGAAMQAVSEDRGAAQLMGVNVNSTISITFAIGSALAAVASLLLCSSYPLIGPYTGAMPGIKAFVAAVFGGIGSIPGARSAESCSALSRT